MPDQKKQLLPGEIPEPYFPNGDGQDVSTAAKTARPRKEITRACHNQIPVEQESYRGFATLLIRESILKIRNEDYDARQKVFFREATKLYSYFPHQINYESITKNLINTAQAVGISDEAKADLLKKALAKGIKHPRKAPLAYKDKTEEEINEIRSSIKIFPINDIGNCERFIHYFGHDFASTIEGLIYYWNGSFWDRDMGMWKLHMALKELPTFIEWEAELINDEDLQKKYYRWRTLSSSVRSRKDVFDDIKNTIIIDYRQFDGDDTIINAPNGIIDLKTQKLMPHRREAYCTKMLGVEYQPDAKCPTWDKFIDTVFKGDKELIRYIQKMCGYLLTASLKEQCVFFLFGCGSNGKSTFINVIVNIMGDYYERINIASIMSKKNVNGSGPSPDLAKLQGARLVVSSEANAGQKFDEAQLKDMRGGDSLTARHLHKSFITFYPKFKVLMYGNHQPRVVGTDLGIKRTIKMIPFLATITDEEKDKDLPDKLNQEKSGILNWMLQGLALWNLEGLGVEPIAIKQETEEYFAANDSVGEFLKDCAEVMDFQAYELKGEPVAWQTRLDLLWFAYEQWQRDVGEYDISRRELTKRLKERGFQQGKAESRYWKGIQLKDTRYKLAAEKRIQQMSEALNNDD